MIAPLLALALFGPAPPAEPGAPPVARLVYRRGPGAEQCPDDSALRAAVARLLGRAAFDDAAARLVTTSITRDRDGLRASIDVGGGAGTSGHRQLSSRGRDCQELARAMGFAIAIAIDPMRFADPTGAPPAPAPPSEPPPPPAPPPQSPVEQVADLEGPATPARTPPEALVLAGEVGVAASFGAIATVTPALRLGASVRRAAWSLGVELRADLPSSTRVEGAQGEVAVFWAAASLVPCGRFLDLPAGAFSACGLLTGGVQRSVGTQLIDARAVVTPVLALGPRLAFTFPVSPRLALSTHADLLLNPIRTTIRTGGPELSRTPPATALLGLSALLQF